MNILTFDIEDWYNHDDYSEDFEWDKFEVRLYEGVDKILQALSLTRKATVSATERTEVAAFSEVRL